MGTASFILHSTHCSTTPRSNWLQSHSQQSLIQYITVKYVTISFDSLSSLSRHVTPTAQRLPA